MLLRGSIEAKRNPHVPSGIVVNIEDAVSDVKDEALGIAHTYEMLQIIVGLLLGRLFVYKRQELQFPCNLFDHVIRVDAVHKFLFPNRFHFFCRVAQTQSLAQTPVSDVTCGKGHVAQYCHSIFCHTIMSGHGLCVVVEREEFVVATELVIQQLPVEFFSFGFLF